MLTMKTYRQLEDRKNTRRKVIILTACRLDYEELLDFSSQPLFSEGYRETLGLALAPLKLKLVRGSCAIARATV